MVEKGGESSAVGSDRRDSSNLTLAIIIGYVRSVLGDAGVDKLLELAGERRSVGELEDETGWSTQQQKVALFHAAAKLLDDPEVGRKIGETVLDRQTGSAVRLILRAVGSPAALCRSVAKASAKFSTNYTITAISVKSTEAVISNRLHEGYQPDRLDCDYTAGLLSQIPAVFGLAPAVITHDECQVDGAPACLYHLHWRARRRFFGRSGRARVADLASQLRLLSERHEALQSTVVDLVSPADVDTVLARITRRAADAVRAQKFLLAITSDDGEPAVHHDGMDRDEALRLAVEILAPIPEDKGSSRLIVDVASSRRSYGRLAAIYTSGHSFFPEERRLLATYARQAAVALDAANALEQARQRGETAQSLLDLARALAQTATTDEVAQRLAEAVPTVIGAQRGSVMLWEPAQRRMVVRAGADVNGGLNTAPHVAVSLDDTPELASFLTARKPLHFHRDRIPEGFIRDLLDREGLEEILVVPITIGDELLGAIASSRVVGSPPLLHEHVLADRLAGLADQASLAFAKVRLIEQERESMFRLRREEERIKHLAYHDALTGLPNGRLFGEALERALKAASTSVTEAGTEHLAALAVLFCDLDRFKIVNDSMGHAQGDRLLRLAAARLTGCTRDGDLVARLGGDEFTLLLTGFSDPNEPGTVAERVLLALRDPFVLDGRELFLSASVGVAVFPEDGVDADTLLKNADAAMYRAKAMGRDAHVRYAPAMNARALDLLTLETDLHNALARGDLDVHYQPEVDSTGRVVLVEALARWSHPERGLIPPSEFIPIAEQSGLILALDEYVLRRACQQIAIWQDQGMPMKVAVNLSPQQFGRNSLIDVVQRAIADAGIGPECLELELTESAVVDQPERVAEVLRRLDRLGVALAVGGYGTGSICGHLKEFPVRRLKIARTFVAGLPTDRYDCAIVSSTLLLAQSLGIEVTAEGVEQQSQAEFLIARGCDLLQGYLYAKPMPASELAESLKRSGAAHTLQH